VHKPTFIIGLVGFSEDEKGVILINMKINQEDFSWKSYFGS
jgi:hypothetical protein